MFSFPRTVRLTAITGLVAAMVALAGCSSGSNTADAGDAAGGGGGEKVTLTFSTHLPETHFVSTEAVTILVEEAEAIAKAGGNTLEIEVFPGEQLGAAADQVDNLKNGVFDMASINPPYHPDQTPLSNVFNLPNIADSAGDLTRAYATVLADEDSQIRKTDFADNGMVPLAAIALTPYRVALTKPIDGLSSIENLKLRSGGGVQSDITKALGAVPVAMTAAEQYEGLQRGTLDGGIFNTPAMIDNKTAEVLKSFATNADLGTFSGALVISADTWAELPQWAQDALLQAGEKTTEHFAARIDELGAESDQKLVNDFGLQAFEFSKADLADIAKRLEPITNSWVDSVTQQGFDGKAALDEARAAVDGLK